MSAKPPVAKYRFTLTLTGNSHEEIADELRSMTRGGYLLDSDYEKRDEFHVTGGRRTSVLEQVATSCHAAQFVGELDAWWQSRKAERRAEREVSS